ncbi:MAG TPA: hypothetical protein VN716_19025 [Vicinamibacterales bacterium]|nr:hypothetical protein [Vicinamibacterales bacterium]
MSTIVNVLAVIGALIVVAALVGGLYALKCWIFDTPRCAACGKRIGLDDHTVVRDDKSVAHRACPVES